MMTTVQAHLVYMVLCALTWWMTTSVLVPRIMVGKTVIKVRIYTCTLLNEILRKRTVIVLISDHCLSIYFISIHPSYSARKVCLSVEFNIAMDTFTALLYKPAFMDWLALSGS